MNKIIILCDFDGTITMQDIGDMVIERFAAPEAQKLLDEYYSGTLSLWDTDSRIYSTITASRKELQEYVREHAIIRNGFHELLEFCKQKKIEFVIVSGGYDYYIQAVLGDKLDNIPHSWNNTHFSSQGITIERGNPNPSCSRCGNCKSLICKKYQTLGYTIISIGDSLSDYCMSEMSHIRFARERLEEHLQKLNKPYTHYDDFHEVIDHLKSQL